MSIELEKYNHRLVEIQFGDKQILTGRLNGKAFYVTDAEDYSFKGKTFEVNNSGILLIRDITDEENEKVWEEIRQHELEYSSVRTEADQHKSIITKERKSTSYWLSNANLSRNRLEGLEKEMLKLEEKIVIKIARMLWEDSGSPSGRDQEFWFRAKRVFEERQREPEIKSMAYSLWKQAGRPAGRDREFWIEAKKRLSFD